MANENYAKSITGYGNPDDWDAVEDRQNKEALAELRFADYGQRCCICHRQLIQERTASTPGSIMYVIWAALILLWSQLRIR